MLHCCHVIVCLQSNSILSFALMILLHLFSYFNFDKCVEACLCCYMTSFKCLCLELSVCFDPLYGNVEMRVVL
jgi:hypothetical protein